MNRNERESLLSLASLGTKYFGYSGDEMEQFQLNSKVDMENMEGEKILGTLHDQEGDLLTLAVVFGNEPVKLMREGEAVECSVCNEKELYAFQGIIVSRGSSSFITYTVRITSELEVLQRRGHVRVPCSDIVFYSVDPEHLPLANEMKDPKTMNLKSFIKGRMTDLSGSGIKLDIAERLKKEQVLIFLLNLGKHQILVKGKVMNSYVEMQKENRHYCYGIAFQDLPERKQDCIVQYVFQLMRNVRAL
jgi:c-di-GMP-binding flagellar brake protein YcgR